MKTKIDKKQIPLWLLDKLEELDEKELEAMLKKSHPELFQQKQSKEALVKSFMDFTAIKVAKDPTEVLREMRDERGF